MSITFPRLVELLQKPESPKLQLRFSILTSDIVHAVLYALDPERGFGEVMLTVEQLAQIRQQFPQLDVAKTGTFPIPSKFR